MRIGGFPLLHPDIDALGLQTVDLDGHRFLPG
jgi:hypothetical protein